MKEKKPLLDELKEIVKETFGNRERFSIEFGENTTIKSMKEGTFLNPVFIYEKSGENDIGSALRTIEAEFNRFIFIVFYSRETSIPDDLESVYKLLDAYEKVILLIKKAKTIK